MIIFKSKLSLKNRLAAIKNQHKTVGFVPTMGALHDGHISLVNKAKSECDVLVASIFVNPTQFNNLGDLDNYPRTFESDCKLLEDAGCDIVFAPEIAEMYSDEELALKKNNIEDKSWANGKDVSFGNLEDVMEGLRRPGHFNGVAQIVSKLFRIVEPNKAYFGQKDFQQLMIIQSMVDQLEMPTEIVICPIIRESNGLAMSSRNKRLSSKEKEMAALIPKTLFEVKGMKSSKSIEELTDFAKEQISTEPQFELEYFEISHMDTLLPAKQFEASQNLIACIALKLGDVRLIDNVILN